MPSTRQLNKVAINFSLSKSRERNTDIEPKYLHLRHPPTFAILTELVEIFVLRLRQLRTQGVQYCDLPNHFGSLTQELLRREKDLQWVSGTETVSLSDTQSKSEEEKIPEIKYSVKYFGSPKRRRSRWRVKIYNNLTFKIKKNGKQ